MCGWCQVSHMLRSRISFTYADTHILSHTFVGCGLCAVYLLYISTHRSQAAYIYRLRLVLWFLGCLCKRFIHFLFARCERHSRLDHDVHIFVYICRTADALYSPSLLPLTSINFPIQITVRTVGSLTPQKYKIMMQTWYADMCDTRTDHHRTNNNRFGFQVRASIISIWQESVQWNVLFFLFFHIVKIWPSWIGWMNRW